MTVLEDSTTLLVSDSARDKALELLAQEEGVVGLRVGVKSGGCSGFQYDLYFDSEIASDDEQLRFGELLVLVDPQSGELLRGASLDYNDGLVEAGFHVSNPNATRSCGCGKSFC